MLGVSLRAFARTCGVSHSTLSRLIRGRLQPTPGLVVRIARALGEPPGSLFARAGLAWVAEGDPPELDAAVAAALSHDALHQALLDLAAQAAAPAAAAAIVRGFDAKLRQAGAVGPAAARLRRLRHLFADPQTPAPVRDLAGGALLYFIRDADRIHDQRFPYGYLDDIAVADMAWREIARLRPPSP